ncbi:putative ribonuclease H-like domain-containing protein [Tanacetum coccineum]
MQVQKHVTMQNSKDSPDARFKPLGEEEKMDTEDPGNENAASGKDSEVPSTEEPREDQRVNQELDASINSTNNINIASDGNSTNNVNIDVTEILYYSDDGSKMMVAEVEHEQFRCLYACQSYSNYKNTQDHPVEQIIGDLNSEPQTKRMTMNLKEHGSLCLSNPLGFEDPDFPNRVYKVEKALYGLHQAPRAWYETLSTYLLENRFQRGQIDKTLFIKRDQGDILIVQVYVDDIIFWYTKKKLCTEFEKMIHKKFQMSSIGELTFFLGLQVKQKEDGIFISQDKYVTEILKKFGFSDVKTAYTPMETHKPLLKDADGEYLDKDMYRSMIGSLMYLTSLRPDIMFVVCVCARFQVNPKVSHLHAVKRICRYLKGQSKLGLWYPKDSPFDLVAYTDSDSTGASLDRKSTTGGCQFLGCRLISWQCKKQTVVANSTLEAKYVDASSCYGQVLWIQNQLLDYGDNFMQTKIYIDNESTICIVKNPFFNSKTKNIEIRHHFIGDSNENKLIKMIKIHTDKNVTDLLTKAFDQFWATTKVKTVNGEVQLQALVDGKKVIITETSQLALMGYEKPSQKLTFYKAFFSPQWKFLIHTILQCLSAKSTAWNEFSSTMASAIICLATNQKFNFSKYIFESMVKNVDSSVKFLMYPRFVQVFLDKQVGDMSTHDEIFVTPSHTKKVFGNMKRVGKGFSGAVTPLFPTMMVQAQEEMGEGENRRKEIEIPQSSGPTKHIADEAANEENVPTQSNNLPLSIVNILGSGEDILKLKELMDLYTKLSDIVLDLETTKSTQAKEIASLKKRVKKLERKRKSKTLGMRILFKIGRSAQVVSSKDEGLGDQEDASKQGRKIDDIDQDAKVTLVDETQGSEKVVKEVSTTTTTPSTIPKAKSITFRDPGESTTRPTLTPIPSNIKDKRKAKMIEPEKPLKMKEQIRLDEELAFKLQAEEKEQARLAREKAKKVEEANISWDNVQAMIKANRLLAERLQAREQEELTNEKKARLFVELLEKRKKYFTALRDQEKRNKPPTKAQKKSTMSTYLKNMTGYKQSQLKNKSFTEIQKLFDKAMTRVNMFVNMDIELVKESSKKDEAEMAQESSSKRAGEELEQEIHRKGRNGYSEIMRVDGSAKTYLLFSQLLKEFDREDLKNRWKLVKAKHGNTRPKEGYETMLWGDLKTMFEDMHVYMLVEKRYPLIPATITDILNKKLQADYWNEMFSAAGTKVTTVGVKVTTA